MPGYENAVPLGMDFSDMIVMDPLNTRTKWRLRYLAKDILVHMFFKHDSLNP